MDRATPYNGRHVRTVLRALLAADIGLTMIGYFFPELWFASVHGTPYDDPEGFLQRCAGTWLMFGLLQAIALWRWEEEAVWLAVVAGARFSDVLTDWSHLWFSANVTTLGAVALLVAGPLNLFCGGYLLRVYSVLSKPAHGIQT